jgi:hypothetical protein
MLNDRDAEWLARFWGQPNNVQPKLPPSEPLTPEPPVAEYPIRKCHYCDALTSREACSRCRALKLAIPFGVLREQVQRGQRTDWPDEQWTHAELQTNWQCAAPTEQAAWRVFRALIERAKLRGFNGYRHLIRQWFFHPEYFTDEGKAA